MAQRKPYRKARGRARDRNRMTASVPETVVVDSVGARGDGIATQPGSGKVLYIPHVLPGERVTVRPSSLGGTAGRHGLNRWMLPVAIG